MNVSKWGNSLAVRLPKTVVDGLALKRHDRLDVVGAAAGAHEAERGERRRRALAELAALYWTLPDDYEFNRDEANLR